MPYSHRPPPTTPPSVTAGEQSPEANPGWTDNRYARLYATAGPTEVLPQRRPASLAGRLRVLELQRDNLNRAIAELRDQLSSPKHPDIPP